MSDKLEQAINLEQVEAILYADTKNPHEIFAPKKCKDGILFQTFSPGTKEIFVHTHKKDYPMEQLDPGGYYGAILPGLRVPEYTYLVTYDNGVKAERDDPYRFSPVVTKEEETKWIHGIFYNAYETLGAHKKVIDDVEGIAFAVWAPRARRVSVVGDFNLWDGRRHMMRLLPDSGIWELFIPGLPVGELYKYEICTGAGDVVLKADPFANRSELRPNTASIITDLREYNWKDEAWMDQQTREKFETAPMNIYELHLGSFRKPKCDPKEERETFYNYRELAPMLADYVQKMHYTHVEFMPVMEHPLDASWGYQVTGYFSATARYGKPEDLMYLIDYLHVRGIGVILDWVPAHFPKDAFGLARFDGECLFENADPRRGEHPHWGTLIFDYGRPQVSNFLISSALFWVEQFHGDALRLDAVASMLYLDYGKEEGEWLPNLYGGNENLEAIEFLKHLNSVMHKRNKGTLMIAEESTAWPKVTGELEGEGLGFQLKWNMGWMNDFLQYVKQDPLFRKGCHGLMTFGMMYAYSEQFILVLSHDEVVHGKGSMIGKMPGDYESKFANLRVSYGFMAGHPGKKLLFMGQEFAQFAEWSEERQLDWNLVEDYESHEKMQTYVADLNEFYLTHPAMYEKDYDPEGFQWISCLDADHSIFSFIRQGEKEEDTLLIICNFTPVVHEHHLLGVPFPGKFREIFNSDGVKYGGSGRGNGRVKTAKAIPTDGREFAIDIVAAPLAVQIFSCEKGEYKPVTKKAAGKKTEPKAAASKEVTPKKTAVKKVASGKTATKKAAEKKAAEKKTAPKKAAPKKSGAGKTSAK